jgi:hypothetical protein
MGRLVETVSSTEVTSGSERDAIGKSSGGSSDSSASTSSGGSSSSCHGPSMFGKWGQEVLVLRNQLCRYNPSSQMNRGLYV